MSHELTCPSCGSRLELAEPALEATRRHGCPLCGATISSDPSDGCRA